MALPTNLTELVAAWKEDLSQLNASNTEKVAYGMVGRLAGAEDDLWTELYDNNPKVARIFDIVADLELPPQVRGITYNQESAAWSEVKQLLIQLESEATHESQKAQKTK